ncbi:MAG: acetylglutamate kinase [Candidatus Nomurabacteria bacterium]|jgi:acetylglutamate kinase|nr:acetylglutamate kinase [Candidatus Nomurabacteria bacterium]
MEKNYNKTGVNETTITEALPYIQAYSGKNIVIKYGGNAMNDPAIIETILQDVATSKIVGMRPILVHGGGPEINAMLEKVGKEAKMINGLRVTDSETMEIVQMVLCGKVNKNLVAGLGRLGIKAIGLCGCDGGLIQAKKISPKDGADLGYVGEVTQINAEILTEFCGLNYVPVIASVGMGEGGESYNINADVVAGEIAAAVDAEKLIYLTDIDGIRADVNDKNSLISKINVAEIKRMIATGAINGGMIPKVTSCMNAIYKGVKNVTITNGMTPHAISKELFTTDGSGTLITAD